MKKQAPPREEDKLLDVGLRSVREAADTLREAANALKKIGELDPTHAKAIDDARDTAIRIKRESGKKIGGEG